MLIRRTDGSVYGNGSASRSSRFSGPRGVHGLRDGHDSNTLWTVVRIRPQDPNLIYGPGAELTPL